MTKAPTAYIDRHVRIPSDPALIPDIVAEVSELLATQQFQKSEVDGVKHALNEALVNSVVHGNAERKTKHVLITYALCGGEFRIRIQDQGAGFSPSNIANPLDESNLLQPHGRGVFMMRKFMDHVEFNNTGNCVTMIKRLTTP